jgi:epoxyqueuosine reductase QueG
LPADAEPHVSLVEWLRADGEALTRRYERLYVPRKNARFLRRNALVALGNVGAPDDAELAEPLRDSDDELLREQAEWALARIAERHPS